MLKPINRKSPEDRRAVPFDPAVTTAILQGQILKTDPGTGKAVIADGAAVVQDPMWAFTKTGRLDTDTAEAVTVLEAPFVAEVDADGHAGTINAGDALGVGTGGNVGKLVAVTVTADATTLQSVVGYAITAPDSDGVMKFKAIR